ncbi:MAG: GNAT family N-acetyltransferase [Cognatishimia sp.]|nr:GNAT family N-acetyltransferase [Cognatishimia sp.]
MLSAGFHQVPKGHVTTVVTHLEMLAPVTRETPENSGLRLVKHDAISPAAYRDLFRRIGQDYLWFSRLHLSDEDLLEIFNHTDYDLYTLQRDSEALGLLELDFRKKAACELAFFGLDTALIGTGAGRYLMSQAIRLAFARPITRFHVHTCTLDSPQALGFYVRSGFKPYKQEIEIAEDPRLSGDLPKAAAPQIPILP